MMELFLVRVPGLYTTVQDAGRFGYLDRGVPPSGALDTFAYRMANLLVGNPAGSAVLEIAMTGPVLEVLAEADIALTGAEMGMTLSGEAAAGWRAHRVRRGDVLRIPKAVKGCRAYLSVTGGIEVPLVMGSRSTLVRAKLGGLEGRILKKGDVISRGKGVLLSTPRRLPGHWIPEYGPDITLRAIPGPQDDYFTRAMESFFNSSYEVSVETDRMGYRLKGPPIFRDEGRPESIVTEPTMPGNVQVPADGQPIIVLVEQTTGGYMKIATVITPDIPRVAQAMPRNRIRFEKVTLDEAHALFRIEAGRMREIEEHLSSKN
ncbi:MAG TPA: biotin-dependent carboxyltransferase family protein [Syntrophales bacterium]|nr:biotin-dependent carboxyltransferase family protein [Syntrophales bacterium]HPI57739.1 biotin-dependent carboxyltransferase family protein [Syntrophales bacterium]HPN25851.1 biotin-dependent carboxyltransferase family protein [Syntrophales bacterium]